MTFVVRTVRVPPGSSLPYDEEEWRDALVTVEHGEVELVTSCGRSFFFQQGDLLWFDGLPVVGLRNRGEEPAVLRGTARAEGVR